jgi:hypothetical protein
VVTDVSDDEILEATAPPPPRDNRPLEIEPSLEAIVAALR